MFLLPWKPSHYLPAHAQSRPRTWAWVKSKNANDIDVRLSLFNKVQNEVAMTAVRVGDGAGGTERWVIPAMIRLPLHRL